MAKNRKYAEGEVPEPTFDKQMEAYSEEDTNADDPIFSSAYHKFMANLLKTRDAAVKNELIEEVGKLFIENNKTILGSISDLLTEQTASVGRVVGEVMTAIEGLDKKLSQVEIANSNEHASIMTELSDLKTRQDNADEKIKKEDIEIKFIQKQLKDHTERFELKKKRIDGLEKEVVKREREILARIKAIDDEIHGEVPLTVFRTYRLEKWIVFFILAILISTFITFLSIRSHAKQIKEAGRNGHIQIENTK